MFRLAIDCIFLSIFLKHTFLDEFISELQALCILSLNIVIDKVYLILWYWYLLVTLLGVIRVLCRVVQILSPQMRYWLMKLKMHRLVIGWYKFEHQLNSSFSWKHYLILFHILFVLGTSRTKRIPLESSLTYTIVPSEIGSFCIKWAKTWIENSFMIFLFSSAKM